MNIKNIFYALSSISFIVILGAAIYEHTAVWPNAFAAAPKSLTMFQGAYPLHAAPFWMSIHPVTLILLLTSLAIHWKTERRKFIIITLGGYALILVTTFLWFVPTLLSIVNMPFSETVNADMTSLGQLWIKLSLVRAGVLVVLSLVLVMGMSKSAEVIFTNKNVAFRGELAGGH